MEQEYIRIKCPVCGAILQVRNLPDVESKYVTCPVCNTRNCVKDYGYIMDQDSWVITETIQKKKKFNINEFMLKLRNSHTEDIVNFLKTIPVIEFSNSSIRLYIYSNTIMLVISNLMQCHVLEEIIDPDNDHYYTLDSPLPNHYLKTVSSMSEPKDTLCFHKPYRLDENIYLSVVTGELDQLWHILKLIN